MTVLGDAGCYFPRAESFHQAAANDQGGRLVPPGLEDLVQNNAALINGAPELERLAGNLHHDFVKMLGVAGAALASPQVPRPEFGRPAPNRFIGDVDATFEQHLLDLPQSQIEPDVQPDRVGND